MLQQQIVWDSFGLYNHQHPLCMTKSLESRLYTILHWCSPKAEIDHSGTMAAATLSPKSEELPITETYLVFSPQPGSVSVLWSWWSGCAHFLGSLLCGGDQRPQTQLVSWPSLVARPSSGSQSCNFARAHWIRIGIVIKIWIEIWNRNLCDQVSWLGRQQQADVCGWEFRSYSYVLQQAEQEHMAGRPISHLCRAQVRVTARFPRSGPPRTAHRPTQSEPTSRPDKSSWKMEPAFRARASGPPGVSKERQVQRPPVYNSEDYTEYLRKYCKFTGLQVRQLPYQVNNIRDCGQCQLRNSKHSRCLKIVQIPKDSKRHNGIWSSTDDSVTIISDSMKWAHIYKDILRPSVKVTKKC